jgi:hypothetical protein
MMVLHDRLSEAKKIRQATIKKLKSCECLWPLVRYRNGSGHDDACPVQVAYLESKSDG